MGTGKTSQRSKANAAKKKYKKAKWTSNRAKDIDQIQDEIRKEEETGIPISFPVDDDLPGLGQFYCTPCARHFINQETLQDHIKSKVHKRRLKDIAQQQYTQAEADAAAGKTKGILPPAHGGAPRIFELDL